MAFPMPCPPPVTRATFLFKEKSFSRIFTRIPPQKLISLQFSDLWREFLLEYIPASTLEISTYGRLQKFLLVSTSITLDWSCFTKFNMLMKVKG
jgi:hypothetical protein